MFVNRNFGDVIESPGPSDIEKSQAIQNIITIIRESQKNNVPVNYDGMISDIALQYGSYNKDLPEIKTLLYNLRDTNPYV